MKHLIKTTFATALFTLAATSFAADTSTTSAAANISPQERAKIEEVVHQYLVNNPQVLVESMQVLQRKQMEEAEKTVKQTQQSANQFADALFRQSADPVAGNPNGKVTVVEFFDYQCPHCVDMAPTTAAIIKANPDVRIVFKDFPIRGAASQLGARAAVAANKQGKYYEFSHALLTANQPITQDSIIQIAKKVGLDTEKLQKDMNDGSVDAVLKANYKLAQDLKLFGTPAFFIAKTDVSKNKGTIVYIPGQMDQKQLQAEIDKAAKS